jgi:hypothetical protein
VISLASVAAAVTLGQVDDFEDGLVAGWSEGAPSPTPPVNMSGGGPGGSSDSYLANTSSGGFGAGGRMAMFNTEQWAGDYENAGVRGIQAYLANFGNAPIDMRIAIQGASGTQYGSTVAVTLPADGAWRLVVFGLTDDDLAPIAGSAPLAEVRASVSSLRFVAAAAGPAWVGDRVVASIGLDDIRATASPVSTENRSFSGIKAQFGDRP